MKDTIFYDRLKTIFVCMSLSFAAYITLISNGLTNTYDGLWEPTHFQAGNWEFSIGRWFWPFIDKIRGGYAADPLNSLLTLFLVTTGTVIALSIFEWKKRYTLYVLLMLISTTTCNFLSYRFMSPTFGFAFIFASVSARIVTKRCEGTKQKLIYDLLAVICLTFSLGCYQATLGVFCVIVSFFILLKLMEQKQDEGLYILAKSAVMVLISCVFYRLIWLLAMILRHTSASSYKGADSVSAISLILSLPANIVRSYYSFWGYFTSQTSYLFGKLRLLLIVGAIILLFVIGILRIKKSIFGRIVFALVFFLIPIAAEIVQLLITGDEGMMLQMSAGACLTIPLVLVALDKALEEKEKIRLIAMLIGGMLLYGNTYMVGIDIDAMLQGRDASRAIMQNVASYLISNDLYDDNYEYVFVGKTCDNPLFYKNENWDNASEYARYGDFWIKPDCMQYSYQGVLMDSGISLPTASAENFEDALYDEDVFNAPCFPKEGSVIKKDNTIIVKISDYGL